jgi:hypothetical protein
MHGPRILDFADRFPLQADLEKRIDEFKQSAPDAVKQLVKTRDGVLPGIPLILGEGDSYCAQAGRSCTMSTSTT